MGRCNPKCAYTATIHYGSGRRLMISQGGNSKYPAGTQHGQCDECIADELAEMNRQLYPTESKLFEKMEEFKKKGF